MHIEIQQNTASHVNKMLQLIHNTQTKDADLSKTPLKYTLTEIRSETQHDRSLRHSPDHFRHFNDLCPPRFLTYNKMTIKEANLFVAENINHLVKPQNHPPKPCQ